MIYPVLVAALLRHAVFPYVDWSTVVAWAGTSRAPAAGMGTTHTLV